LLDGEIIAAEQLAVSRTAYREAVRILAAKGLVDARPKVGTRVNPQALWHLLDPDVLDWTFESEPDLVLLDSLFELRDVVESAAAAMAAQRRSSVHLQEMRAALEGMATHTLATELGRRRISIFTRRCCGRPGTPSSFPWRTGCAPRFAQRRSTSSACSPCAATPCRIICGYSKPSQPRSRRRRKTP